MDRLCRLMPSGICRSEIGGDPKGIQGLGSTGRLRHEAKMSKFWGEPLREELW